MVYMYRSGNRS